MELTEELTASLKAFVNLDLGGRLDKMNAYLERLNKNTPVLRRVAASGIAVTSTTLIIDLGTPDKGTFWNVENIVLGGVEVNVAAAGSAGMYVVGGLSGNAPGLNNAVDYAATLPNVGYYGFRDVVVSDSEHLIVAIFGGTNDQQYVCASSVSVYPVDVAGGRDVNVGA